MDSLIHRPDDYGETMIHCAARKGHVDVVRFLIDELKLNPTARHKVCVCLNCSCTPTSSIGPVVSCVM